MVTTIRPKDEPAATSVAGGDIFLIDGATGVRGLAATQVVIRDANANVAVNNSVLGYATTATAASTTTLLATSSWAQYFTGTLTQTVALPVVSTLQLGHSFYLQNSSTGAITVTSSGGGVVATIAAGTSALISCILITGTTASSWSTKYHAALVASGKVLTVSNSLTLAGTDGTVQTFPSTSGTVVTSVSSNAVTNAMAAQASAATLKMNATAGAANVTDSTIQGLANLAAPSGTLDFIPIFDHVSGTIKNVTPGAIASSSVAGVASLNTATGAISLSVVVQKFTASGTYTPTPGMKYAIIECVGPGGGGGGVANGGATTSSSGAGGTGAWSRARVTAAAVGASKVVTVGTGGAGGAAAAGNGAAGSAATSVGALCVANAGGGGTGVTSGAGAGVGGTGGAGSGIGDLSYSGVPGQSGFNSSVITTSLSAANGPSTPYGTGGKAAAVSTAPGACDGWGGGGAAVSVANASGNIAGGAGGDGGVLITEFVIS